ncbi:16S rRNA (uracil(1498)-N(3))-methyltransferase [Nitratiruptor sp. YY09-18]|uniref:16S rRNA (uracil(1498)-N(3))-methyltransferase n=1 Tax=Nitratiruptor sp. YY09-18 TaxID=2724901 RepID=UPI0019157C5C|nr:16S rRNA (uracil(1498)-N(3))-methyltransferase [Nitratiruptor sp. YY09-18]BCD68681.1 16S rRNA (uracil1498-N3)-methyltransferase [Nitratiruptor sp. YY09-18]
MQFVYHPEAGQEFLHIEGEVYNYIFKVRRHCKGKELALRNMHDGYIYFYKIDQVSRRDALLTLVHKEYKEVIPKRYLHILWCVIDPKSIEKTLPSLNEIGVSKISFVYCDRSQKNFKLRLEKLQKILINSSQQCGRSRLMELEIMENFSEAMRQYPDVVCIDFSEEKLQCSDNIERVFIGPEGGFSKEERAQMQRIVGLDTPTILRSETAAVAVASKVMV